MPVTMPRTFTVVPLQAELAPSVWMLVIGTMPSRPAAHGAGPPWPRTPCRTSSGVGASGPVKSATLSSVSWVPLFLRANAAVCRCDGWDDSPAPSR